ncbi:MAG TPA: hypothetical protein VKR06_06115 [Ktedonosporobacter sp.]|nr:hypothetical protein [Ktedonosporobacter sp.]
MRDGPQPFWRGWRLPRTAQFFTGLIIGTLPLLITLFFSFQAGQYLWMGLFIASIACICIPATRYAGYGLLTMFFVSPVIFQIACMVMLSSSGGFRHYPVGVPATRPILIVTPTPTAK